MNLPTILAITGGYVILAIGYFLDDKIGPGIVFTGYAIANLGFIYDLT